VAVVAALEVDRATAVAMVMATDDYAIGHVFRTLRLGAGARPATADEDRARVRELLATGEFPNLAGVMGDDGDITPPPDTFETGLEWLFDGMQAAIDARRE
jgi:tetracycline repressor-like protein